MSDNIDPPASDEDTDYPAEKHAERPQLTEQDSIGKQMWRFYRFPKYTDMTIECNGKTWQAHRNIIAAQSTVFSAMLEGKFAESSSCRINLPDDDPALIECVIQFLYTRAYGFAPDDTQPPDVLSILGQACRHKAQEQYKGAMSPKEHAKIYALADKYGIPTLAANVKNRYWTALITRDDQKKAVVDYFESIEDVYTLTPNSNRGLRDIAIHYIFTHHRQIDKMMKGDEKLSELRRQTLLDYPEFAVDVVTKLMAKVNIEPVCDKCGKLEREAQPEDRALKGEVVMCMCARCHNMKMFCHRN